MAFNNFPKKQKLNPRLKRQGKLRILTPGNPDLHVSPKFQIELPDGTLIDLNINNYSVAFWLEKELPQITNIQHTENLENNLAELEGIQHKHLKGWQPYTEIETLATKNLSDAVRDTAQKAVQNTNTKPKTYNLPLPHIVISPYDSAEIIAHLQQIEKTLGETTDKKRLQILRDERINFYLKLADKLIHTDLVYNQKPDQKTQETQFTGTIQEPQAHPKYPKCSSCKIILTSNENSETITSLLYLDDQEEIQALKELIQDKKINNIQIRLPKTGLSTENVQEFINTENLIATTNTNPPTQIKLKDLIKNQITEDYDIGYSPLTSKCTFELKEVVEALHKKETYSQQTIPTFPADTRLRIENFNGGFLESPTPENPFHETQHSIICVRATPPNEPHKENIIVYNLRTKTIIGNYQPNDKKYTQLIHKLNDTIKPENAFNYTTEKNPYAGEKEKDPRTEKINELTEKILEDRATQVFHEELLGPTFNSKNKTQTKHAFYAPNHVAKKFASRLFPQKTNPLIFYITNTGLKENENQLGELAAHELAHGLQMEYTKGQTFHHSFTWAKIAHPLLKTALVLANKEPSEDTVNYWINEDVIRDLNTRCENANKRPLNDKQMDIACRTLAKAELDLENTFSKNSTEILQAIWKDKEKKKKQGRSI